MLFSPVPSTRLAGHSVPHPGHFLSTKGSSPKAALLVTIVPEEVASESTRIDSMVIATASPTLAPSTATGRVTSCPPRNSGVIIGPQQPGGTTQRMCPPSLIVAAKPRLGPTRPPVYSSTKTSFLMSLSIVCMRGISFRHTGGTQIIATHIRCGNYSGQLLLLPSNNVPKSIYKVNPAEGESVYRSRTGRRTIKGVPSYSHQLKRRERRCAPPANCHPFASLRAG